MKNNTLQLIENDGYLKIYSDKIQRRLDLLHQKEVELSLTNRSLSEFACGHLYFGLHHSNGEWIFREFAPNAIRIDFVIGSEEETAVWTPVCFFPMRPSGNGNWEVALPDEVLHDRMLYRLKIYWAGGCGERLPAWCNRVVQDPDTFEYSAQVWIQDYQWKYPSPRKPKIPFIYEAHIGMATEDARVGTFNEFHDKRLSYIKEAGYNAIQIIGIQEHPYYGSFGYQVSNFFAVSSRFGTPEELKSLIDEAHGLGLFVIMDLVHSHSVKNELEGLNLFDGDPGLYFYPDQRRNHVEWGTLCFNYGKGNVIHFLLSNCKYWLEEFNIDGFRFDGVSSMLYNDHGLHTNFNHYDMYFDDFNINYDAMNYLQLANLLVHQLRPSAITIAEEVSGMPGVAYPVKEGGIGFDYRLNMGIPDYWIRTIEESNTGNWDTAHMFFELTRKRKEEKTISYVESHDQALVGDQTIIFRMLKEKIYDNMLAINKDQFTCRAVALHKMIRLVTLATSGNGYLNFMGNEFGHPEWIDFPRKGNNWSYQYARRQWSLLDPQLKYYDLGEFDKEMLRLFRKHSSIFNSDPELVYQNPQQSVLIFQRGGLLFFFNFGCEAFYYPDAGNKVTGNSLLRIAMPDPTASSIPDNAFIIPAISSTVIRIKENKCKSRTGRKRTAVYGDTVSVSDSHGQRGRENRLPGN